MNKGIVLQRSRYLLNLLLTRGVEFEPPYLDERDSDIPSYPPLNVQVKGYDFTVLEKYGKWVNKTANWMDIEIQDTWPTPCKKMEIITYKKNSKVIENKYNLQIYERNIQIIELSAILAPTFIEIIKAALPEGVEMSIHEHMEEYEKIRKIPDLQLKELKKQLDEMGGPLEKEH